MVVVAADLVVAAADFAVAVDLVVGVVAAVVSPLVEERRKRKGFCKRGNWKGLESISNNKSALKICQN